MKNLPANRRRKPKQKKLMKQWIVLPMFVAALVLTAGCEKGTGEKVGEKLDNAAEKTGEVLKDAADKTGDALKTAGDKLKETAK